MSAWRKTSKKVWWNCPLSEENEDDQLERGYKESPESRNLTDVDYLKQVLQT